MKHFLIFFLLTSVLLILSNCSNPPKDKSTKEEPVKVSENGDLLTDIYWKLIEINGKAVVDYPTQNKEPFLSLKKEGNRVEGTGGCNSMGGAYALTGDNQIRFSQLISTKMACPDMTLEVDFHAALEKINTYDADGKVLTLSNETTGTMAKFEAKAR